MSLRRARDWTTNKILPLFDWSSADAKAAWAARKYTSYIGSPELIGLVKDSFIEIFSNKLLSDDELRVF